MQWFKQKRDAEAVVAEAGPNEALPDDDKNPHAGTSSQEDDESELFDGVKAARAITSVWPKSHMWLLLAIIYLYTYIDGLMYNTVSNLERYITSSFAAHELMNTIYLLQNIFGAVSTLVISKIINIWGRIQGLIIMVIFFIIGAIIKCTSPNIQAYAAASVFYSIGKAGLGYTVSVIIADMTTLRHRMLIVAISQFALLTNGYSASPLADRYLEHSTWQWAYGTYCILIPFLIAPMILILWINLRKAKEMGLYTPSISGRSTLQSLRHYIVEFDVIGVILITAAFTLLLLPLSMAGSAANAWRSAHIIVMIIIGGLLLPVFYVWERFFAPIPYLPWKYLKRWNVISGGLAYGMMYFTTDIWDIQLGTFLQVVLNVDFTDSNYILNAYSAASYFFGPLVGYAIHATGRYKWLTLVAMPFEIVGTALLVAFRKPGTAPGLIAMTQVFVGIGGAIIPHTSQIAMMAAVTQAEIAPVLAIYNAVGSILSSIGATVGGAIWNSILPKQLYKNLPDDAKNRTMDIFADMTVALAYPMGTPTRDAINVSYGETTRIQAIVGACMMPLLLLTFIFWKDYKVIDVNQTKGHVI